MGSRPTFVNAIPDLICIIEWAYDPHFSCIIDWAQGLDLSSSWIGFTTDNIININRWAHDLHLFSKICIGLKPIYIFFLIETRLTIFFGLVLEDIWVFSSSHLSPNRVPQQKLIFTQNGFWKKIPVNCLIWVTN